MNLFIEAGRWQENGVAFAMATIIAAKGSTPRNTAKMLVKSDGSIRGTIGGGPVELQVIQDAVAAIRESQSRMVEYNLNSAATGGLQMLCGGVVRVFIEVIAVQPQIVMIGAGHVGLAVAKAAALLSYNLVVVDNREEFANPEKYPMAVGIACDPDIQKAIAGVPIAADSYVIIATADVDYPAVKAALDTPAAYIGMIGSKRKVALVKEHLRQEGVAAERLAAIYAPVGLDIGSETPEEIAISIMAEIMKVRNGKTGLSMRDI